MFETDVLIVGTGPAGSALACFLGHSGIRGLLISRHSSTAQDPRAHYTNAATMQCLRDIGLEYDVLRIGRTSSEIGGHYLEADTFVSGERLRSLGFYATSPESKAEAWKASPCSYCDIPQSDLEPLLLRHATNNGFHARWDTEFVSFEDHSSQGYIISTLRDLLLGINYQVKSKYVCGADGANSRVASQLGLAYQSAPVGQLALNVYYEANLEPFMDRETTGILRACSAKDFEPAPFGVIGVNRVVRPWSKFLMIMAVAPQLNDVNPSEEDIIVRTKQLLGCDPQDFKLLSVSKWRVTERFAQQTSRGNIFCLGDAIHQHPPNNGLGLNTCIQDAFNLAWKIAAVFHGTASSTLLESYNQERQPVAQQVVETANRYLKAHLALWAHLGFLEPTSQARNAVAQREFEESESGRLYRKALKELHGAIAGENRAIGLDFNQIYRASTAVMTEHESSGVPQFEGDPHFQVQQSTYPGFRVPHAWLSSGRTGKDIPIIDLCGKGGFTLITGVGGKQKWQRAAALAAERFRELNLFVHSVGPGQDFEDVHWMWETAREVDEDGVVLVRPDLYVCWRFRTAGGKTSDVLAEKLIEVFSRVLGFSKSAVPSAN